MPPAASIPEQEFLQEDEADLRPIPFDRRRIERHSCGGGRATAFELGGETFGKMHDLELIDHGAEGIGAFSQTPISPGTIVSLGFDQPWLLARRGEVVWCTPCGRGYRVGLRLQMRLAA